MISVFFRQLFGIYTHTHSLLHTHCTSVYEATHSNIDTEIFPQNSKNKMDRSSELVVRRITDFETKHEYDVWRQKYDEQKINDALSFDNDDEDDGKDTVPGRPPLRRATTNKRGVALNFSSPGNPYRRYDINIDTSPSRKDTIPGVVSSVQVKRGDNGQPEIEKIDGE